MLKMVDVHVRAGIEPAHVAVLLPSHLVGRGAVLAEHSKNLAVSRSFALRWPLTTSRSPGLAFNLILLGSYRHGTTRPAQGHP